MDAASASPVLVINEIMPNPAAVADELGEWFEIHNAGTAAVDLQGYILASANDAVHIIDASVVVPAGGYVVLARNGDVTKNGGVNAAHVYRSSFTLANGTTDWLALRSPSGVSVDSVAWGTSSPPTGASRGVVDPLADNTVMSGANWATSVSEYGIGDKGTPGEQNFGGEAVSVIVRATSYVTPGTTYRISATATDADGKPSLTSFTWESSDPTIATIDRVTGVARGVATAGGGMAGIVTITATSFNGIKGTGTLFVVNTGDVASISININEPAQVPVGYTKPAFSTTRTTTGATVTPELVWSSSDPSIATVSERGYITGARAGSAVIRAIAPNGVFGESSFTVIPADVPTSAVYRNHVEFGTPVDGTLGDDYLVSKKQFVSSWNKNRGGPNWVSWNINSTQFGSAPRCDCFSTDLTLPSSFPVVVDFDYRNSGYQRGHMVQSESRTTTDQENAATFLFTNILPQAGNNNTGPWLKFENYTNDLARQQGKEIYVIAGGEYSANPQTLKGEGKIAIPEYTWKIAVIMDGGKRLADIRSTADLKVIAVRMPNTLADAAAILGKPWQDFEITVNAIEAATGYNFLDKLPDTIERFVESGRPLPAAIDIIPGSAENPISLNNKGLLPVAILTSGTFDAAQVDVATIVLGNGDAYETSVATRGNGSFYASLEDVNRDGKLDLVVQFSLEALRASGDLNGSTSQLILQSRLKNQVPIQGSDKVRIVT